MRKYIRANRDGSVTVFECNEETNLTTRNYDMNEADQEKYKDKIEFAKTLIGFYLNQVLIEGKEFVVRFQKRRL